MATLHQLGRSSERMARGPRPCDEYTPFYVVVYCNVQTGGHDATHGPCTNGCYDGPRTVRLDARRRRADVAQRPERGALRAGEPFAHRAFGGLEIAEARAEQHLADGLLADAQFLGDFGLLAEAAVGAHRGAARIGPLVHQRQVQATHRRAQRELGFGLARQFEVEALALVGLAEHAQRLVADRVVLAGGTTRRGGHHREAQAKRPDRLLQGDGGVECGLTVVEDRADGLLAGIKGPAAVEDVGLGSTDLTKSESGVGPVLALRKRITDALLLAGAGRCSQSETRSGAHDDNAKMLWAVGPG